MKDSPNIMFTSPERAKPQSPGQRPGKKN